MMKLQDVILKAMAKKITWLGAAEIIGVCDRTMRRMRKQYEEFGYNGLFDQTAAKEDLSAGADGNRRTGAGAVPGNVLRPERAALSREAAGRARNPAQL